MSEVLLEEQLFAMSARARVRAGVLMLLGGAGALYLLWGRGVVWYGAVFCVLFGAVLLGSGYRDAKRQAAIDAEVERAEAEWQDLKREIELARRTGGNASRLLQQRGYREFFVRRWILAELDPGLPPRAGGS